MVFVGILVLMFIVLILSGLVMAYVFCPITAMFFFWLNKRKAKIANKKYLRIINLSALAYWLICAIAISLSHSTNHILLVIASIIFLIFTSAIISIYKSKDRKEGYVEFRKAYKEAQHNPNIKVYITQTEEALQERDILEGHSDHILN